MGSKVGSLCGNNLRGLGRGNGTIGVSNKTAGIGVGSVIVSVPSGVSVRVSSIGNGGNTLSGKVSSLCSYNLRGLGGGNSTVRVGDKVDSRGSSHASKENQKLHV